MDESHNVVAAFSEDKTERLTGVTKSQLRYWDRTGFFKPSFASENRRAPFSRIYSFRDIVSLRVLNILRNQYSVSLSHLRSVSERLSHLASDRWVGVQLYVLNKRVIWREPGTGLPQEIASKQYVVPMKLEAIASDTERIIRNLNRRDASSHGQVTRSRYVNHNTPVISGTRIPVLAIKRFAQAGYGIEQIRREYPDLTDQDVRAAIDYQDPKAAA